MKLNLTDKVLDTLGFSEYWDEHCTWGGRTLTFKDGTKFRIIDQEEMADDTEGNWSGGVYIAHHFTFATFFAIPKIEDNLHNHELFFLHDMYDCITHYYPQCVEEFVEKCNQVKMGQYIEFHIKSKAK